MCIYIYTYMGYTASCFKHIVIATLFFFPFFCSCRHCRIGVIYIYIYIHMKYIYIYTVIMAFRMDIYIYIYYGILVVVPGGNDGYHYDGNDHGVIAMMISHDWVYDCI